MAEPASRYMPALAGVPEGIHDAWVQLTGELPGRGAVRVTLPLIIHLASAPKSGSLVQVDYEHRVLRLNETKPLMIQGYYDVPSCGRGTANATRACFNLDDIHTQAKAGYTSIMYYHWAFATIDQQRQALDVLAESGMMLIADLSLLLENIACGGTAGRHFKNCTQDAGALAAAWATVKTQVQRWKSHPASVLGVDVQCTWRAVRLSRTLSITRIASNAHRTVAAPYCN